MISSVYDDIAETVMNANSGTWASKDPKTLGGSQNRAAPNTITDGVGLSLLPSFASGYVDGGAVGAKTAGKSNAPTALSTFGPAEPALVRGPSGGDSGPSIPVIAGAAAVGLGLIGLIVYKLRKKH